MIGCYFVTVKQKQTEPSWLTCSAFCASKCTGNKCQRKGTRQKDGENDG